MMTGKLRPYEPLLMTCHRVIDALMGMGLLLGLAWFFKMYSREYLILGVIIFTTTMICLHTAGIYRSWRVNAIFLEISHLLSGCFAVYVVLIVGGYFLKVSHEFSRLVLLTWMILWPALLMGERFALRTFLRYQRKRGRNLRTCVIAGAGDLGKRLARWIESNPWSGTKISGFFDDGKTVSVAGYPVLGKIEDLPSVLRQAPADLVYLALPMRSEAKLRWVVAELSDTTASIYLVPDIFFFDLVLGGTLTYFDSLPIVSLRDTPFRGFNALMKRLEDLALSMLILPPIIPLMLAIAIAIKLTSKGPVFFKQWRYGLNGDPILIYKFRTMTVSEDGYQFQQASKDDPRVTPLGAFLRRTSLDELPQIINVLQGRMSIVGPRPHPVAMNEEYRRLVPGYMLRHKVKPGITGLAQANGWRGETDTLHKMERRIDYDLEYLRQWSIFLDCKIIFKTITNVARRVNAY